MSPKSSLLKRYLPQASVRMTQSLRHLLGELGVVVAARLGAVAAADEEEVADRAALHRLDHLAGHAQHGLVAEADQDGLLRRVGRETVRGQRRLDDRREIAVAPMCATPGQATSPEVKMRSWYAFCGC